MVLWSIAENILIKLFQEDYSLVLFTLCFSHRLELALKDAIKKALEPVDVMSLSDLYCLYAKSSKKHRESKNLFNLLEGQFKMYTAGVHPVEVTSMRWIDHKI